MNKQLIGSQFYIRELRNSLVNLIQSLLKTHCLFITSSNKKTNITDQTIDKKQLINISLSLLLLINIILFLLPSISYANHNTSRQYFIKGDAATGINDLCGLPLFNLAVIEGIPPTIHATILGEYNPDGETPIPISPSNCDDDIVVVTNTDPNFLARAGLPDIDIRLKNIPLRDVPVISSPDGRRSTLPSLNSVPGNALPPTKSNPNGVIKLGDWLNAQGWMYLRCNADGTAKVKIRFKNLIPNGLYSLWGLWNATPPGASQARLVPVPLGGIPNAMVPDEQGRATFTRQLASCPKDQAEDESIMLFVDLAYHSDGDLSGAFPQIVGSPTKFKTKDGTEFSSVLVPGAVTHDHVLFLISGDKL